MAGEPFIAASGPGRPRTLVSELPLETLPVVHLPAMLPIREAPARLPPSVGGTGDLTVWHETRGGAWGWSYTVHGFTQLTQMQFDPSSASFSESRPPICKPARHPKLVPARWEGISRSPRPARGTSRTLQYAIVDGWFDLGSCLGAGVRKTSITLIELVPELVYAARTCSDGCSDGHADALLLATPPGRAASPSALDVTVPFDPPLRRTTVPLREGAGGTVAVLIRPCEMQRWQEAVLGRTVKPEVRGGEAPVQTLGFWLSVDTSHVVAESAPVGLSYLWRATAEGFSAIDVQTAHETATECRPRSE